MAVTAPTAEEDSATPGRSAPRSRRIRVPRAPSLLIGALVVLLAYGAFAHGAAQMPDENRLQVALALVAIAACAAWLFDGGLRLSAPRLAWIGVGLLVGFVVWTA